MGLVRSGISSGKKPAADERRLPRLSFDSIRVLSRPFIVALFFSLLPLARAGSPLRDIISAASVSGQFVVTARPGISPLVFVPDCIPTNADIVRLDPAVLAVSADRFREAFLKRIGVNPGAPWGGKIFLALHPAQSLDENVKIFSTRFGNGWNYNVLLPDILPRDRLARALTGVLLLEFANRFATDRTAELPPWLVDGLSQELRDDTLEGLIVSMPGQAMDGFLEDRLNVTQRGMDPLADARAVLQNYPVLTFTEMSWPSEAQVSGEDGGVYRASTQLFVDRLLNLRDSQTKMRTMLTLLPRYYNWQTAFWSAYHDDFSTALEVEKWWALQSVIFVSRSPGPQWTPAVSRQKLDEILSVPVEFREGSNSLPATATVSLQNFIQNFDSTRQNTVLESKLRDLEIAQFRMAPSLAVLTAEYRNVIAGYLGEPLPVRGSPQLNRNVPAKISARDTIRTLDFLDARRRAIVIARLPNAVE